MGDGDIGSSILEGMLFVFIMAGIVAACGIILFLFISRQLAARMTGSLEEMKGELSRKLEVHRLMNQYRADAIDKLYIMLAKIARETALIVDYHKAPPDPHRQYKLNVLVNTFHQLADHIHESKLYIPDNIASRVQTFLTELREAIDGTRPSLITHYSRELHLGGQADRWSKLNYDLTLLLNDVQSLARGIIGIDESGRMDSV